eukprot:NODE_4177_length_689_cov_60.540625_g3546_i0.p1 GENE.NODE_4177_length_689_cov_60.540625_g3546_i0~~NODE_4177_length_689_cov_60.540625_g3546_i0.p1  ORF type:complete len:94 (+),score=2.09 NODE_4177_length_689_cov_60.540625_g3546_i0:301-582(+)
MAGVDSKSPEWFIKSVNISGYIARHYVRDDFVVCKMDIEQSEFVVIPHMVKSGVMHLIDELFLECHNHWKPPGTCHKMFLWLRSLGIYVHEWA